MGRRSVLPDYLTKGLRGVLCGTAASGASSRAQGYYAGPGNEFWVYLYRSGLTHELLSPARSRDVLDHGLGLTDLAKGVAANSDRGLAYDVEGLRAKLDHFRPGCVAFHGKEAAKQVSKDLGKGGHVALGPQAWGVGVTPVYVLPSASGSNRIHRGSRVRRPAWNGSSRSLRGWTALADPRRRAS